MLNKITLTLVLIFISLSQIIAQTESFTISWDLNTEPDIYNYHVFRSTSPGASNQIGTVQHPGDQYTDNSIEKGVQYFGGWIEKILFIPALLIVVWFFNRSSPVSADIKKIKKAAVTQLVTNLMTTTISRFKMDMISFPLTNRCGFHCNSN